MMDHKMTTTGRRRTMKMTDQIGLQPCDLLHHFPGPGVSSP